MGTRYQYFPDNGTAQKIKDRHITTDTFMQEKRLWKTTLIVERLYKRILMITNKFCCFSTFLKKCGEPNDPLSSTPFQETKDIN